MFSHHHHADRLDMRTEQIAFVRPCRTKGRERAEGEREELGKANNGETRVHSPVKRDGEKRSDRVVPSFGV